MEHFGIGKAVKELIQGARIARAGWNGKDMWLSYVPADQWGLGSGQNYDSDHISSRLLPWIGMKTADGAFVPWLASQTDILALDWFVVAGFGSSPSPAPSVRGSTHAG